MTHGGKDLSQLKAMALTLTAADVDAYLRQHRPPANWQKWTHCAKAELWQCVALSFGVEPVDATMRMVPVGAMVRASLKPRPWFAEHGDMRERLHVALANAGLDVMSTLHPLPGKSGDMALRVFSTAAFGAWARSIWGAEVPAEFPGHQPTNVDTANAAEPAPVADDSPPSARPSVVHAPKRRADALTAVLIQAEKKALDASDRQSVWAALVGLAQSANRPPPLLGYTEGEGVKYQSDDAAQPVGWLNREAFRGRFRRKT